MRIITIGREFGSGGVSLGNGCRTLCIFPVMTGRSLKKLPSCMDLIPIM